MNIITCYGTAEEDKIEVKKYIENMYLLCYLVKADNDDSYVLLGFTAPTKDYPEWEFWVEIGDSDGFATIKEIELTAEEENYIKSLYNEYANAIDEIDREL